MAATIAAWAWPRGDSGRAASTATGRPPAAATAARMASPLRRAAVGVTPRTRVSSAAVRGARRATSMSAASGRIQDGGVFDDRACRSRQAASSRSTDSAGPLRATQPPIWR
jgi:hypothetical protein